MAPPNLTYMGFFLLFHFVKRGFIQISLLKKRPKGKTMFFKADYRGADGQGWHDGIREMPLKHF
jgi:hypothetical protein